MTTFFIILVLAFVDKNVAADECDLRINQLDGAESACLETCYEDEQREGLVKIMEVRIHKGTLQRHCELREKLTQF